jgi:DNA-binding PadR family transcriptional regulator
MSSARLETQNLTRSCHEVLILATLAGGRKHGYQLVLDLEQRSEGQFSFNHGTLYPILHKLEKDGLIRGSWDEDSPRRKRKSYVLTRRGRRHLGTEVEAWRAFADQFFTVVGGSAP